MKRELIKILACPVCLSRAASYITKNSGGAMRQNNVLSASDVSLADNDTRYTPRSDKGPFDFCGVAHEIRYNWVFTEWDLTDKIVLDFGCGSGYGVYLLSKKAKLVYGIDRSHMAIEYAKSKYSTENLKFFVADACSQEEVFEVMEKNSIDIIVSFDVIEHLEKYFDYLANICSLLKQDGVLVIGCPNRLQLFKWNRNWNRFHFQEFSAYQLEKILSLYFNNVVLVAQDFRDLQKREAFRTAQYGKGISVVVSELIQLIPEPLYNILKRLNRFVRKYKSVKPTIDCDISDIELKVNPGYEALEQAFGLVAICKDINEGNIKHI